MYLVGAFQIFSLVQLYPLNYYYIDILNLGILSDNSVLQKYLLSSRSPPLYCDLYKPLI